MRIWLTDTVRKQNHIFAKMIIKCLRCNCRDRGYIPVVLLSFRKYALLADKNLRYDLKNFLGSMQLLSKDQRIYLIAHDISSQERL